VDAPAAYPDAHGQWAKRSVGRIKYFKHLGLPL